MRHPTAPKIMAILNVTPDSFSDGGRFASHGEAIDAGIAMFSAGAAIVDVGGESSRPGAEPVDTDEELARVLPVVNALSRFGAVSIDTRKPIVARAAAEAGASILNDTTTSMGALAGDLGIGYVAMHSQGVPATMQDAPQYDDVVSEVWGAALAAADAAARAGAPQVWVDPGIGFGKTTEHNMALLQSLPEACTGRRPVLLGASRKRIVGELTGRMHPAGRIAGSLAIAAYAAAAGVDVIRTHDVPETIDFLAVFDALSAVPRHALR